MKQATQFVVHGGWKILLTDIGLNHAAVLALAGREDLPVKFGQTVSVEMFDPPIFARSRSIILKPLPES